MEEAHYHALAEHDLDYWWFKVRHRVVWQRIARRLPEGPQFLVDIGCGTGGFLASLLDEGAVKRSRMCGFDWHQGATEVAERRGIPVRHLPGGIAAVPKLEHAPDVVTMLDVLEHLPDPLEALRQIRGWTKPGGHLVLLVPAFEMLWSDWDERLHHYRRYSRRLLRQQLGQAGWEVLELRFIFNSLFVPALVRKFLFRSNAQSDFPEVSPRMNRLLAAWFLAESRLPPLPFGTSVLAVAKA